MLSGLFQHSSDSCYSCKFFYSVAGIFSDSKCSDWHHDPVSKEKELMRHLFQVGLPVTLNLSLTLPKCRESLIFCKNAPLAAPRAQIPCWNEPEGKNKVIPGKESKAGTNWNNQIRTRGCDECDPKHCFISASHPFFFQWLLLTAALIRNSQEMLFKKYIPWKRHWFSFPFVSFT